MKKLFLLISMFTIFSTQAFAKTGLGIILGDPTGFTFKSFMANNNAVDGAIAYNSHELVLYADILKHFPGTFGRQNEFVAQLTPYIGVGPVFAFDSDNNHHHHGLIDDDDDDFAFGARIPLGIEWMAKTIPLGLSLEIVPGMTVISETNAFLQGGLALRYYF